MASKGGQAWSHLRFLAATANNRSRVYSASPSISLYYACGSSYLGYRRSIQALSVATGDFMVGWREVLALQTISYHTKQAEELPDSLRPWHLEHQGYRQVQANFAHRRTVSPALVFDLFCQPLRNIIALVERHVRSSVVSSGSTALPIAHQRRSADPAARQLAAVTYRIVPQFIDLPRTGRRDRKVGWPCSRDPLPIIITCTEDARHESLATG